MSNALCSFSIRHRFSWGIAVILIGITTQPLAAADSAADVKMEQQVQALIAKLEVYLSTGMKAFDVPAAAVGIVVGDRLVYHKGFGVRSKTGKQPVNSQTIFQIGSTTKAFLATTIAMAVDHGKLHWEDHVIDHDGDFQMKDPWVTREFRVFDLLAQRSGLPPYANDLLGLLGYSEPAMIHSLRDVDPISSFRSAFAYTNVTHMLAGDIVAKAEGAADWNHLLQKELLNRLGMKQSTYSAKAIQAAPNHAEGYRFDPSGSVEVPFNQLFPYDFGGAGDINSNIDDMSRWVRLQLGNGTFEGRPTVSPANLAVTRMPRVAISDKMSYASGWIIAQTPNGTVVWHNGGTSGFGAYVGLALDKHVGVIILSNQGNVGFPDAIGAWTMDRLLENPIVNYAADMLQHARKKFSDDEKIFAKPAIPQPAPPLASLAGTFTNPSFGTATITPSGGKLVLALNSGAQLILEPWDGGIFTVRLAPNGRLAAMAANNGPRPIGFVQFQIDNEGKRNVLRFSSEEQSYEFHRVKEK